VYWYARVRIRKQKTNITVDQLDSILLWLTISMIIGARIFEVVFWQWSYYSQNLIKIFAIWEGGLSFHGGLVAITLATILLCRRYNISVLHVADLIVVPVALGQGLGRFGNFFNHELVGKISTLPWAVNFKVWVAGTFVSEVDSLGNAVFRHPNQLYEAGYNIVIFLILYFLRDKFPKQGTLFALFLVLYAIFRFFTEFLRVGEPTYGGLTVGQLFNVLMLGIGAYMLYRSKPLN
jgi:phosphatidylglycerol:prolipoprotein diacylglycerol transferase